MSKFVSQYDKGGLWKDIVFETGCVYNTAVPTQWIFENYAKTTLYYSFNIGNKHFHEHDFPSVLKYCFDYPESFNLKENDVIYYTEDQIYFLNKLQKQGISDNFKDIMVNNTYSVNELKKRNYQTIINNLKEDN